MSTNWERYTENNLRFWRANNPGKDIYKEDALVKRINEEARNSGRSLNGNEVSKIRMEIYE